MKKVALIMAGGKGTRLWPLSTPEKPKQFISLTKDGETLIQKTYKRVNKLVEKENIFIITGIEYKHFLQEQIPSIPDSNIILEPCGRNTAPAIAFSALYIKGIYKDDFVMMVFPSDHYILDENEFIKDLNVAAECALSEKLVTIGIEPTEPNPDYGYIKVLSKEGNGKVLTVDKFVEKPTISMAEKYLETKMYCWNAGIFIWKVSTFFDKLNTYSYELAKAIEEYYKRRNWTEEEYLSIQSISIDYALLEKASNVCVVPASFGWSDLGSFMAIYKINNKDSRNNVWLGTVEQSGVIENSLLCLDSNVHIRIGQINNLCILACNGGFRVEKLNDR